MANKIEEALALHDYERLNRLLDKKNEAGQDMAAVSRRGLLEHLLGALLDADIARANSVWHKDQPGIDRATRRYLLIRQALVRSEGNGHLGGAQIMTPDKEQMLNEVAQSRGYSEFYSLCLMRPDYYLDALCGLCRSVTEAYSMIKPEIGKSRQPHPDLLVPPTVLYGLASHYRGSQSLRGTQGRRRWLFLMTLPGRQRQNDSASYILASLEKQNKGREGQTESRLGGHSKRGQKRDMPPPSLKQMIQNGFGDPINTPARIPDCKTAVEWLRHDARRHHQRLMSQGLIISPTEDIGRAIAGNNNQRRFWRSPGKNTKLRVALRQAPDLHAATVQEKKGQKDGFIQVLMGAYLDDIVPNNAAALQSLMPDIIEAMVRSGISASGPETIMGSKSAYASLPGPVKAAVAPLEARYQHERTNDRLQHAAENVMPPSTAGNDVPADGGAIPRL